MSDFDDLFSEDSIDDLKFKIEGNFSMERDTSFDAVGLGDKLKGMIYAMLVKTFPNNEAKQMIATTSKGYQFSCPYCGDSKISDSKKRGHVYLGTSSYKCWNCYTYRPLHIFLEQWGAGTLTYQEKESLSIQHIISNNNSKRSLAEFYNEDIMFDKNVLMKKHFVKSINNSVNGTKYMMGRNAMFSNMNDFAWNEKYGNLYMFNTFNDKVLGLQIRLGNVEQGRPRFISYHYEDIRKKILKEDEYDVELAKSIEKVSMIYNILNIDFSKEVPVTESTINSKYFQNSVAMWGSNPISIKNGLYFFDNDDAGRKASIKMLNAGNKVFLWQRFLKDFPQFRNMSDINDIMKFDRNFDIKVMKKYLGDSKFDKNWL